MKKHLLCALLLTLPLLSHGQGHGISTHVFNMIDSLLHNARQYEAIAQKIDTIPGLTTRLIVLDSIKEPGKTIPQNIVICELRAPLRSDTTKTEIRYTIYYMLKENIIRDIIDEKP